MKRKVFIDPLVNIMYASFYVEGLYEIYGKKSVVFSGEPFRNLSLEENVSSIFCYKGRR